MKKTLRIHEKLSGKHILWFGEGNQWVGLEIPAYKVFKWNEKGRSKKKIVKKICRKYGLNKTDSKRFVNEIINGITEVKKASGTKNSALSLKQALITEGGDQFITHTYKIHTKYIQLVFGNRLMEYYFHPLIAHHKIENCPERDAELKILSENELHFLYRDGEKIYVSEEIAALKRKLNIEILNVIYETESSKWFTEIHASAVSNSRQAVLLSSESGSGKSTLAALLQTRGLHVFSDDLVAIHRSDLQAYPLPTAISIKHGAFQVLSTYFPELDLENTSNYEYGNKEIRFIPPEKNIRHNYAPVPVSSIVFIKYKKSSSCKFKRVSAFDSFKLFHQQAWVNSAPENATQFFKWFKGLSCYELIYSDTELALNTIENLLREN